MMIPWYILGNIYNMVESVFALCTFGQRHYRQPFSILEFGEKSAKTGSITQSLMKFWATQESKINHFDY